MPVRRPLAAPFPGARAAASRKACSTSMKTWRTRSMTEEHLGLREAFEELGASTAGLCVLHASRRKWHPRHPLKTPTSNPMAPSRGPTGNSSRSLPCSWSDARCVDAWAQPVGGWPRPGPSLGRAKPTNADSRHPRVTTPTPLWPRQPELICHTRRVPAPGELSRRALIPHRKPHQVSV